jgi:glycine hydroxymethyltransferase
VIDFERMSAIAREVGAYLFVDMAHIAGLVAGGVHPSPVPHADFVSGPLMHVIAAKAVCFGEALKPGFKEYQQQIVKNAQALAAKLTAHGFRIVSGGTDNHVMMVDLRPKGLNGSDASHALDEAGITVNKNAIPFDTGTPMKPSGIRIGTPAVTTRGMKEKDVEQVSDFIAEALAVVGDEAKLHAIRDKVFAFNRAFPMPM